MRKVALAAVILFTLHGAAAADIVILKDGSRTEGVVTDQGDSIRVELEYGSVVFPKRLVERLITCDTPRQKYQKKLAAIDQRDIEQLTKLQQWCTDAGLKEEAKYLALKAGRFSLEKKLSGLDTGDAGAVFDFALWCRRNGYESRIVDSYLWKVVSLDPGNTAAREMLGYRKFRGQWLGKDEIAGIKREEYDKEMRLKGMVKYDGQWLKPDAASCLRQLELIEEQRDELELDRQRIEDDMREIDRSREKLAVERNSLYSEQNSLRQREEAIEQAAFRQMALARRLACERDELTRLKEEARDLKDELEREKDNLHAEREKIDREKSRLHELSCRIEREWRLLRNTSNEKKDCRPEAERPKCPKKKIGSEEHPPGRRSSYNRDEELSRRERVRR